MKKGNDMIQKIKNLDMNNTISRNCHQRGGVTPSRPTIALLGDELGFHIPVAFLKSALAVAETSDVNLIYFSSEAIRGPYRFDRQANIFYDLINRDNVDGLLLASNLIGSFITLEELEEFLQRYASLPMVSMGVALTGIPSVV